jgi:uncharacterized Rmd1/YagE family protein
MYHLPLLPGYGPGINIRSSAAPAIPIPTAEDVVAPVSEAEETAYESGMYLSSSAPAHIDSFMPGTSPGNYTDAETPRYPPDTPISPAPPPRRSSPHHDPDMFGEAVFFQYGVVVFFGLDDSQEHSILDDIEAANIMQKPLPEDRWEVEECHYEVSLYV